MSFIHYLEIFFIKVVGSEERHGSMYVTFQPQGKTAFPVTTWKKKVTSAAKQPSQRVWHETFAIPFPATMTLETMRAKLRYEGGKRFDVGTCSIASMKAVLLGRTKKFSVEFSKELKGCSVIFILRVLKHAPQILPWNHCILTEELAMSDSLVTPSFKQYQCTVRRNMIVRTQNGLGKEEVVFGDLSVCQLDIDPPGFDSEQCFAVTCFEETVLNSTILFHSPENKESWIRALVKAGCPLKPQEDKQEETKRPKKTHQQIEVAMQQQPPKQPKRQPRIIAPSNVMDLPKISETISFVDFMYCCQDDDNDDDNNNNTQNNDSEITVNKWVPFWVILQGDLLLLKRELTSAQATMSLQIQQITKVKKQDQYMTLYLGINTNERQQLHLFPTNRQKLDTWVATLKMASRDAKGAQVPKEEGTDTVNNNDVGLLWALNRVADYAEAITNNPLQLVTLSTQQEPVVTTTVRQQNEDQKEIIEIPKTQQADNGSSASPLPSPKTNQGPMENGQAAVPTEQKHQQIHSVKPTTPEVTNLDLMPHRPLDFPIEWHGLADSSEVLLQPNNGTNRSSTTEGPLRPVDYTEGDKIIKDQHTPRTPKKILQKMLKDNPYEKMNN